VHYVVNWAISGIELGSDVETLVPHLKSECEGILVWNVEVRLGDGK
jgi:hypothetical protein